MVDRAGAELDRERNRTALRELVAVQPQRQSAAATRLEVAPRLLGVEGAALQEHVGGVGELCGVRKHLGERELEIRVGVHELRRHSVSTEPRRCASGGADRTQ